MSLDSLLKLVTEAQQTCEARTCKSHGHLWESDGARACPRGGSGCSQSFFVCSRCGMEDYGEEGGPGYEQCYSIAPHLCDGTVLGELE